MCALRQSMHHARICLTSPQIVKQNTPEYSGPASCVSYDKQAGSSSKAVGGGGGWRSAVVRFLGGGDVTDRRPCHLYTSRRG